MAILRLPADWLVIIGVIVAVAAILFVCAVVAKRKRYGRIFFFNLNTNRPVMKRVKAINLIFLYTAHNSQYFMVSISHSFVSECAFFVAGAVKSKP